MNRETADCAKTSLESLYLSRKNDIHKWEMIIHSYFNGGELIA